ncbi:hypothetical protein OG470_23430 [Micromonospora sp. NBC_00389]|uniref:hypothetical protein n=1 Tax=Micromonospora sp. NBC_00389 TaxID=2903586 RepID=UPI002E224A9D
MDQPTATFIAGIISALGSTAVGLGGLIFAMRNTSKTLAYQRDETAAAREHEIRLRRDTEHREDQLRWHRERREAYGAFAVAAGKARQGMLIRARNTEPADVIGANLGELRNDLFDAFSMIQLISAQPVRHHASSVLTFVDEVIAGAAYGDERWTETILGFRAAAREDLVPGNASPEK